ncbi:MAG: sulfite exporter TauE/SafE family protein [Pseudomonadota bacterium]|nr:sulfite exporter TauE/SafE family protein [Pseudomonadota bacterium]
MQELANLLAWPHLPAVIAIVIFAGVAHGVMGFGFPVFSTPMVALLADVQAAVLATLFPNLAVNLVSTLRGGDWRESIGKYWPVAVYVLIGTVIGTRILLYARPGPIKLLLAAMIVVYLEQKRFRALDWSWLKAYPRASAAIFGLTGGVLSGSVNVAVPPLVIYFMALELPAVAMTQILNLCFLVGRATQAVAFGISGRVGVDTLLATLPLTIVSLIALAGGMALQRRIPPDTYNALLRKILWAMAVLLAVQSLWSMLL